MSRTAVLREKYGPWALVTGASSGIGEQFARQLARAGFNLLLVARREDRLRDLRAELGPRRRREIEPLVADLADPEAVDRIVAGTAGRDLGLLVSNAGFGLKGAFESHGRARLEAMLNVNARAPLLLVHALLPRLRTRPTGGIILTGSQEGEAPFPWSSAYAATKAFVHSLGMGLHGELAGTGIDVLVLAPGATDTEALRLQGFDVCRPPATDAARGGRTSGLARARPHAAAHPGRREPAFRHAASQDAAPAADRVQRRQHGGGARGERSAGRLRALRR